MFRIFYPEFRKFHKKNGNYYLNRQFESKFYPSLAKQFEKLYLTGDILSSKPPEEFSKVDFVDEMELIEFDARIHPYFENYFWSIGKTSMFKKYQNRSDCILMRIPSALSYISFLPHIEKPLIVLIAGNEQGVIKHREGIFKKMITILGDAKIREITENSLLKKAEGIITRNVLTENRLKRENKISQCCEVREIPAGIDTDLFSPATEKKCDEIRRKFGLKKDKVVGFVATELSKHKGARELRKILKKLMQVGSDINFLIVGSDHYGIFREFKEKEEITHFEAVKRKKLPDIYRVMDVFIFPATEAEGAPKVLMEASSCNVPCVSTRVAAIPSIIKDGETGFLSEPGDSDKLFEKCKQILDENDTRKRMGKKARKHIKKNFSYTNYVSEFSNFVKEIIEKNS